MPYSDYGYLDPIHIRWRKGTADDPYVPINEYLEVEGQKLTLAEVPDRVAKVKIAGLKEINYDGVPKKSIAVNEFSVNYSTGIIEVHHEKNGINLNVSYIGKGLIQYPSSRIYHRDGNVVETLSEIIKNAKEKIDDVDDRIADYKTVRDKMLDTIVEAQVATAETKKVVELSEVATGEAIDATQNAIDAYNSTIMIYLAPVLTYAEIATKYPIPVNGDRVMVESTGDIYRYDGIVDKKWERIENYTGGAVPKVTDNVDGLMRREDYTHLHNVLNVKNVFFILGYPESGVAKPLIAFPFNGEILNFSGYCVVPPSSLDMTAEIQKISKVDFETDLDTWTTVGTFDILVNSRKSETALIANTIVSEGDYFRVFLNNVDGSITGLTIQIDVKI